MEYVLNCYDCGEQITFDEAIVSKSGRKIPLNAEDHEPHYSICRPRFVINCRYCDKKITFSDDVLSKNGKKIPLDAEDYKPHRCNARGYH